MRKFLTALAVGICVGSAFADPAVSRGESRGGETQSPPSAKVELVESFPLETSLDTPEIRQAREVWLELIGGARKSLDIEVFYIRNEPGQALEAVIAAIRAAAGRGVRVRILADAKFRKTYPDTLQQLDTVKGIEVRTIDMGKGVQHSKFFLVDGREFYVGSQNFDWTSLTHIRELGVHVTSPELTATVERIFEQDWDRRGPVDRPAGAPFSGTYAGKPIELYPAFSPFGRVPQDLAKEEEEIVRLLDGAKEEAMVEVMTYSTAGPYPTLDDALRRAAGRGVRVQLLVADWALKPPALAALKSLDGVPHMEVRYSHVPAWSGGEVPFSRVDHCKFLTVDGQRAWVGTSNWERGYFYESRDLGLVFTGAPIAQALRAFFLRMWESPYARGVDVPL